MTRFVGLLAVLVMMLNSASGQVTLTSRTNPSYTLTIDLSTSSLVSKSCSSGSFTYQPLIAYDMVFSSASHNPLTVCSGKLKCTSAVSSFALPLSGGTGTVLGDTTLYTGTVSCSQANPYRLQCNTYSLSLSGPDFFTTATTMYSQSFALPLHLISFDARDEGNRVHLFWKVASEMPDIRFELQSSSDARQWSLCSVETVSNRVTDGVKFSAYDLKPLKDIKYYRIRQIDADGAEAFSRTIAVRAGADLDFIKISPNPIVGNQLRIEGFENIEDWRIDAVNMSGQSILILPTGKATISLPNLRSGVYALRFTSKSTGEVRTLTFSRE